MQKIEKWRIQELELVLNQLNSLLRKGNHKDWANIISHFQHETQKIFLKKNFDLDELKKLINNIKNCYSGSYSFKTLWLRLDNTGINSDINRDFSTARARLFSVIYEMEKQTLEYVN